MSDNLYTSSGSGGLLRHNKDNIRRALQNAHTEGKLHGIPSTKFDDFADAFEEQLVVDRGRIGTQITKNEVAYVMKQMRKNKHDKFSDSELGKIEEILTDQNFDIE